MTSCLPKSNEHAEDVEVSSKNGVRSHETQSDGVAELNRRHRSPNQTASAQSRECVISESLRQDKSKMLEAAKCSGATLACAMRRPFCNAIADWAFYVTS